jgi:hypothetical protein
MTWALVFNHESLPFDDIDQAKEGIEKFIRISSLCRKDFAISLLLLGDEIGRSLFDVEFANDFFGHQWYTWANRQPQLKEDCQRFRSLQTRQPMLLPEHENNVSLNIEVGLTGKDIGSEALQAAYYYQLFLISFGHTSLWCQNSIDVWVLDLSSCENNTETAQVSNLNSIESFNRQHARLGALRDERLGSGRALWGNRTLFFPNLVLLNEVGSQLRQWPHNTSILNKAREAMGVLNQFVESWQNGQYNDYQHDHLRLCGLAAEVSGESESVNSNPKKRAKREFYLPTTGIKVNFQNHIKLPGFCRLHFYPCPNTKIIYIGYIGQHLPL